MANFVAFQLDAFQNDAFQSYIVEVSIDELRRFAKMYALADGGALVALSAEQTAVAFSTLSSVVSLSTTNAMFIQHKPRRDAPPEVQ
jgi:hypothetical protein